MIDEDILEKKLDDFDGHLESMKMLNEQITEFINDMQDESQAKGDEYLYSRAYRTIFFAHIIDEKIDLIQSEIQKLIPCQQST